VVAEFVVRTPCGAVVAQAGKGSFDSGEASLRESSPSLRMTEIRLQARRGEFQAGKKSEEERT
jgi:hypothetical protein